MSSMVRGGQADKTRGGQDEVTDGGSASVGSGGQEGVVLVTEVKEMCTRLSARDRNAEELNRLLSNPHLEALIEAHDNVAMKKYEDSENEPSEYYEMEVISGSDVSDEFVIADAIRIVGIRKKDDEPLGMTVKVDGNEIYIARILSGGVIDRQGLLHVGDRIIEVNGNVVNSPEELQDHLRTTKGSVTFKIQPSFHEPNSISASYMRALYSYDPNDDSLLPCKELGLEFEQGDILEILNQEDPNWWQARKVGGSGCAGLVPSQELEERRRAFVRPEFDYATKTSICGTKVTKKKKKEMYQLRTNGEFDKAELILYEEVCRMPPFERKTLILIGAQGVGRRTLKSRLINYDMDRFASPLPHTSRPIKEGEIDGKVYHFVKRELMEADIADNKYQEYGEHQGHLYGTKLDSIRAIIRSGKMCVIDCNPQCLKMMKTAEFMPFIVFISAPTIDQLRFMHEWGRHNGSYTGRSYTFDRAIGRNSRRGRTLQSLASFYEDEDLQSTIEESARLQRIYEKYFDMVIVNSNFEKTFEQLRESVDALSAEPQWIPISWIYSE